MKVVIIDRISDPRQETGHSLAAQRTRIREYCTSKDLEIIKEFEFTESSTRGDRKVFMEAINFAINSKDKIAIVCDRVDRFQRSFKESVMIDQHLKAGKVELHFYKESLVLNDKSPSYEILRWDMSVLAAKSYVMNLSDNVKRTIDFKIRNGQWINRAPVGYKNVTDPITQKKTLVVDPEMAYLVKKGFEMYSTGNFSFQHIANILKEDGLRNNCRPFMPLSTSQIHKVLQNPFYFGFMRVKGELHKHIHPTIIDEWLFRKCQEVREGWHKKPFKYATKPYLFRGLIKCGYCGCAISTDRKKNKYNYLCCTQYRGKCGAIRIREEVVLAQLEDIFKKLAIPEFMLVKIKEELEHSHNAKKEFHDEAIKNLEKNYELLQQRLDRLLEMRLDGSITKDEYDKKAQELKQQQWEQTIKLKQHTQADEQFSITISYLLDLTQRAYELFNSSKVDQKRQLLNFVLSNLELKGEKLDYKLKKPFDAILDANIHSSWLPD